MFKYPHYLWWLLLLVPVASIFIIRYQKGKRGVALVGGRWREEKLANIFLAKSFFVSLTFMIALFFLILSLAELYGGMRVDKTYTEETDVIFLVDVSRSMLARDLSPGRLEKTKAILRVLLEQLSGRLRLGLVIFKGRARELIPLTEDRAVFSSYLDYLSPMMMSDPGTNLEEGIKTCLKMFPAEKESRRILLLFSDGESLTGDVDKYKTSLINSKVQLITIGTGTEQGATIILADGAAVKDSQGARVISRLNTRELKSLAELGGGRYFSVTEPDLINGLKSLISGETRRLAGARSVAVYSYQLPLALGLIFLIIYIMLRGLRWADVF